MILTSCRLLVGAILLAAGAAKAMQPEETIRAIHAFHLLPPSLSLTVGATLPGIEVGVGAALVLSVWTRAAALLSGLLVSGFLVAIGAAMAQGLDVDCGCFGRLSPFARAGFAMLGFDALLLAACFVVYRRHACAN
ncbi:MAG: MauE/DoxX family redox-associated membrane protein [Planctomycetota bacterium]